MQKKRYKIKYTYSSRDDIRRMKRYILDQFEYVKNLSDKEMEEWYDETYQMFLLCFLEYNNIESSKKINKLF